MSNGIMTSKSIGAKSVGKFEFDAAAYTTQQSFDTNRVFTIKRDSMPENIFQPMRSDINRESLHRLPARKQEHKNSMYKQI